MSQFFSGSNRRANERSYIKLGEDLPTIYELPSSLLVANPINRYLLNSPMLPEFVKERRWRPDALCPERFARQRRIAERAACAQGPLLHCDAPLLAEAGGARWHVEAAAEDASRVVSTSTCGQGSAGGDRPN